MRVAISFGVLCLTWATVLTAPAVNLNKDIQSDDIEQELVRHHHAARTDASDADDDANSYSEEKGNINDDSSPVESIEENPENSEQENGRMYDEEDLYDITVGDVIRDVLMTLHDNPEIVKALMETEKEKIASKLAQDAMDNVGADLSEYQRPAEQLQSEPKRVEKKDGKAGHAREAAANNQMGAYQGMRMENAADAELAGYMNHKRTNEVLDETFSPESSDSSSQQYEELRNFMNAKKPKINKYKALYGSQSGDESESASYRRHFADSSDSGSDDSSMRNIPADYRFPFINPFAYYSNFRGSDSSDSSSSSQDSSSKQVKGQDTGSDETETETDTKTEDSSSESSEANRADPDQTAPVGAGWSGSSLFAKALQYVTITEREQLSWLLRQMEANNQGKEARQNM